MIMKSKIKNEFLQKWEKYFGKAELPFVYFYTPDPGTAIMADKNKDWSCIICELARVRNGESLAYDESGLHYGGSSIVYRTHLESLTDNPKAFLGMFDCSARPCVPKDILSFSIPMKKLLTMLGNIDESFLITETWQTVRKRIN